VNWHPLLQQIGCGKNVLSAAAGKFVSRNGAVLLKVNLVGSLWPDVTASTAALP